MTFRHKLSARLALLRDALLITALATAGCELPQRNPGEPSLVASRLLVAPDPVAIYPDQTVEFMGVGFTEAGDTAPVDLQWTATAGTIVDTSSQGGRHYAHYRSPSQPGHYHVRARVRQNGLTDSAQVAVAPIPVASVVVSPASASLFLGRTLQLSATLSDSTGAILTGRSIAWTSSNNGIASVTAGGLVTAAAAGSATITATSEGQSGTSTITVTIVPVASVSVAPSSASLTVGQTQQLSATPRDSTGAALTGRVVTWSTNNGAVASVSGSGLVTAVAAGSATITATSEGQTGTSAITVTFVPVASVSVTPASASLIVGQTQQLSATLRDSTGAALTGRVVTWSTNNGAVASVSGSGLVTAVAAGSASITATSEGKTGTSAITVTFVPVASVSVTPASASLYVGRTQQLTATPRDSTGAALTGRPVTWATSNAAVASVSASGLVTAVAVGSATITATSEGKNGTSAITVSLVPVASVSVTPASATLSVAETVQLTATPRDSTGAPLTGRTITWATSNAGVASVSASGLVTAVAVGSATITATSGGTNGTSAITVQGAVTRAGYYVSPSGSASGNGSAAQPWNLATALNQPSAVHPGDTIWLRGGTYQGTFTGQLSGTASAPIIVRQYPGERAIINGTMTIDGAYTWYWGFELMHSSPASASGTGFNVIGDEIRFINLIVHDTPQSGFGFWSTGTGGEIYGTIIYNVGRNYNLDHGIYTQNAVGTKRLIDNVIFHTMAYGIHVYGSSSASLKGYLIEGNTVFYSGAISPTVLAAPILLVGGDAIAQGITVKNNMTLLGTSSTSVLIGYSAQNQDVVLTGNYFAGGSPTMLFKNWSQATVSGNTLHGATGILEYEGGTSGISWSNNTYYRNATATAWSYNGNSNTLSGWKQATGLGATDQAPASTPTGVQTFVRPNAYEPGRGFVTIFNWALQTNVDVDVSGVLSVGDRYEVYNVQALFGAPALSGTYGGGSLSFPMAAVSAPVPIGGGVVTPPSTGPKFQVFLIKRAGT